MDEKEDTVWDLRRGLYMGAGRVWRKDVEGRGR